MSFQSIEPFQSNIPTLIPSRYMIFCKSLHISGGLSGRRAQRAKSMPGSSSRRPREPLVSQFSVALSSPSSSAPTPKLHKRTNRPSNSRSLYLCIIVIKQCQMWGWRYVNLVAAVTPFTTGGTHSRTPVRQEALLSLIDEYKWGRIITFHDNQPVGHKMWSFARPVSDQFL